MAAGTVPHDPQPGMMPQGPITAEIPNPGHQHGPRSPCARSMSGDAQGDGSTRLLPLHEVPEASDKALAGSGRGAERSRGGAPGAARTPGTLAELSPPAPGWHRHCPGPSPPRLLLPPSPARPGAPGRSQTGLRGLGSVPGRQRGREELRGLFWMRSAPTAKRELAAAPSPALPVPSLHQNLFPNPAAVTAPELYLGTAALRIAWVKGWKAPQAVSRAGGAPPARALAQKAQQRQQELAPLCPSLSSMAPGAAAPRACSASRARKNRAFPSWACTGC